MRKRMFVCCFLMCIFMILTFTSCSTDDNTNSADDSVEKLQNIFYPTTFDMPDDFQPRNFQPRKDFIPYYDPTSETVTFFYYYSKNSAEAQTVTEEYGALITFSTDGTLIETSRFNIEESIGESFVTKDAVIYTYASKQNHSLYRLDRETEETTSVIPEELFGASVNDDNTLSLMAIDSSGNIYCSDKSTLYVLNPDLSPAYTFKFPSKVYTMARGADGNIWVTFSAGMESCAAAIDPETKALGEYLTFVRGSDMLESVEHRLINAHTSSEKHSFYYYDSDALYGVTVNEDGSLSEDIVVDFYNSGIDFVDSYMGASKGVAYPVSLLSEDILLTVNYDYELNRTLTINTRGEDLDLSSMHTITIACAYALDPNVISKITRFNKEHSDIRVIVRDYSEYSTTENMSGGEEKLCFDIMNGYIKPDMVMTEFVGKKVIAEDLLINQLIDKNLYVDLTPYLESNENVNFDTLFGCIPRIFDDGHGGIWGLCTEFTISTLLGSREKLGEYAEKGYWTMGEMLDFFDSLPDGAEGYYNFMQFFPTSNISAQGYNLFIDEENGLDTESFIRYLEFLKACPIDLADRRAKGMATLSNDEQLSAIIAGDVGTTFLIINDASLYDSFRCLISDVFYPIGFPTKTDSGIRINTEYVYAITTYAEEPDLCFDLLATFFDADRADSTNNIDYAIFAQKTQFETIMEDRASKFTKTEALTPDELSALYDVLDNAGSPIIYETTESVNAIISEEVSAYLSDIGTAQSCAEKIESRINIWLSEHED